MLDLIIIGASAAGCSAAVYAARRNLNFRIVTKNIGGEVALSGEVENWPGTIKTDGITLARQFADHARSYNTPIDEGLEVKSIETADRHHVVVAKKETGEEVRYETKTVIIASGIHPRLLGIPGEEEYRGKGVTYCTVCDGPLYRKRITATVGSGNAALESALMMSELATKVFLISKYPNTPESNGGFPKGENILVNKIKAKNNVEIIYNASTTAITGNDVVNGITYRDNTTGEEKNIAAQGVMVHIGMVPNTNFTGQIEKNAVGEIKIDLQGRTSAPGIFAAGDVTNLPFKQIAIAAGQGVTAALSAIEYINRWHE